MGHCLNVRIFEITSVHIHPNVNVAQFSEQSQMKRKGVETLSKVSASGKKRPEHAELYCRTFKVHVTTLFYK